MTSANQNLPGQTQGVNAGCLQRFVRGHNHVTLYLGDCLEILPGCDAVISDPPYGIAHKSSFDASWSGKEIAGDRCTTARDTVWNHYAEKPRAMFGISWKQPPPPMVRMSLIWNKGPAFGAGDLRIPWKPSWEEIYIGGEGWIGKRDEGVLSGPVVVSWESKGRMHPHQKPVWLMCRLIEKLPDAQVILDPFMGSGTTGIACLRMGRNFVGVEIDPEHFKTACARLEAEINQGALL
jgi:DNA modification methylase